MVRRTPKGRTAQQHFGTAPCLYLNDYDDHYYICKGSQAAIPFHRFIWALSHQRSPGKLIVHHINGNPLDNRPENLEAMSRSEHGQAHGVMRRAATNP